MNPDDDDDQVLRIRPDPPPRGAQRVETGDSTNYMALNHAAKQNANQVAQTEKAMRKPRPPKLKLTSTMLLAPPGLTLLAKQCRQARVKRKEGREGIQLAQLIQLYDAWAKQLCPGYDMNAFYNKVGKLGNERVVKDQTEALIAARNRDDLDSVGRHLEETELAIEEHRATVQQRRMVMEDDNEDGAQEESAMVKSFSAPLSVAPSASKSMPIPGRDEEIEIELPEGDFAEPEGLDMEDFGGYDD